MKLLFAYLLYFIAISAAQNYPPPDYSPPIYDSSYCEMNDDEYGRSYYSPYDNYHPPYSTYGPYDRPTPSPTPRSSNPTPGTSSPTPKGPNPTPGTSSPTPKTPIYPKNVYAYQKRQTLDKANECHQTSERCYGYGVVYDNCGRRCTCRNGSTTDCCRVRKEWNCMTQEEKCRYVNATVTISTDNQYKDSYDELIHTHQRYFQSGIHGQHFFLPWHRWYILGLENLLRKVDCRITVPYWDWSAEPTTWQQSNVWNTECGFGGNGNPNCDTTGPFTWSGWRVTPSAGSGCLQRNFNGNVPDCATVAMIQRLGVASFNTWHTIISSNLHDSVHCNIGGHMCTINAANDPIFFLHHGFIDKLWADWQGQSPLHHKLSHYTSNNNVMPGTTYSPSQLYDLQDQPGCIKICYQPQCTPCYITNVPPCTGTMQCCEYSPVKLARLVPRPYPYVGRDTFDLFRSNSSVSYVSNRFSSMMNSYENIYSVLETNGYDAAKRRPPQRECTLDFDSYIYNNNY